MSQLENKIALVTGASRGIGLAIATTLAKAGATVIGTATTEANTQTFNQRFAEQGLKGKCLVMNIADAESITHTLASIVADFGSPDILVNNAGITRDNLILRMKEDEWNSVIDTNLTGAFRVTKACLRAMLKARWGRIINLSSVVGATGNPGQANYAASKAALVAFSKSIANELASRNITTNVVAPGFITTDMTDALTDEQKAAILDHVPMGRMGSVDDIANAVKFLVSDEASYITGTTLHVNGGMFMPS